jgi:hypothetical protein
VFLAGAVVQLLHESKLPPADVEGSPMVWVTDGVLAGWVHRHLLEPVPVRPRSALERLTGPDDL